MIWPTFQRCVAKGADYRATQQSLESHKTVEADSNFTHCLANFFFLFFWLYRRGPSGRQLEICFLAMVVAAAAGGAAGVVADAIKRAPKLRYCSVFTRPCSDPFFPRKSPIVGCSSLCLLWWSEHCRRGQVHWRRRARPILLGKESGCPLDNGPASPYSQPLSPRPFSRSLWRAACQESRVALFLILLLSIARVSGEGGRAPEAEY